MALVPMGPAVGLVDLEVGDSAEAIARLVNSQRELFHSQIEQLQKLVIMQCNLTGVNPLAQEMAAGALSVKIGKRPRDLLNPKAIKYMQSIFSVKDTIGKKESREISSLCGVTVTQVKEYFAGQRSKVRKLVRDASKAPTDRGTLSSNQAVPITQETPTNNVDLKVVGECMQAQGNFPNPSSGECSQIPNNPVEFTNAQAQIPNNPVDLPYAQAVHQNPGNSTISAMVEKGVSCSTQGESIPDIGSEDEKFLENIFNLMRKEETFSGQVKLMEWVLQIQNVAVLQWFLTKGGLSILATWLSQAAVEEQTTVVLVIFKVLCHLPLYKALPVQMSAILQTVNRLRFYRTSDISNRAKCLLSRWSKLFIRRQIMKKPSVTNPKDTQKEMLRQQRICEILRDDSWLSKVDNPEELLALDGSPNNYWNLEPMKGQKLLLAPSDDLPKKNGLGVSTSKTKERRKVLPLEQPDRKTTGRTVQVARAMHSKNSRPISADDIQKAKMRASFMQNKYGKTSSSTSENKILKVDDHKLPPVPQASNRIPASRVPPIPQLRKDGYKNISGAKTESSSEKLEPSISSEQNAASPEKLLERMKRVQLQWQTPPAIRINTLWRVGLGENSKEVGLQTQRNQRGKESLYPSIEEIPPNPKDPWDTEMDFDDSLTPEVPIEQAPEPDAAEGSSSSPKDNTGGTVDDKPAPCPDPVVVTSNVTSKDPGPSAEPDLELLAVLLKNPELVFALTSGQGTGLTNEQTMNLLDTIKKNGVGLTGLSNGGFKEIPKEPEPEPTSLPSPTPHSEARNVWRSEFPAPAKVPVQQPRFPVTVGATAPPTIVAQTQPPTVVSATVNNQVQVQVPILSLPPQSQAPVAVMSRPQLITTVNSPQHVPGLSFQPQMYPSQQSQSPVHYQVNDGPAAAQSVSRIEQRFTHHNPSSVPFQYAMLPTPSPSRLQQPPLQAGPSSFHPRTATWTPTPGSSYSAGRRDLTPNPYIDRANGVLDAPASNLYNQINYSTYSNGHAPPVGQPGQYADRNGVLDMSDFKTWSPGNSPVRSSEFGPGRSFPEQRRDLAREPRPDWSGHRPISQRDRHHRPGGGRKGQDRDRDRDRGRGRDPDPDPDRDRVRRR